MAENETETKATAGEEEEIACEEDNDVKMESDDSSSDDDDDGTRIQIEELKKQVNENPYMYDNHVTLIKALREAGELEDLRNARQRMSKLFPLSEELWLDWLKDEVPLATEEDQRNELYELFDTATKDYLSVPIWLEYVQYAIGGMGSSDGVKKVRDIFERALVAGGLHVTNGANLWEAYREFENAILAGLLPQPGVDPSVELQEKFSAQHDRVSALFKRQLSVPLFDMDQTLKEYKDWLQEEPETYLKQSYNKALTKLKKIREYEEALLQAEAPRLEQYESYLKFEEAEGDPSRIQVLYERALQENCLIPKLWLQYTKYLDTSLRVDTVTLPVYERAVRNCPWCVQLWQNYILCLERYEQPYNKVKDVFEAALTSGFSQGSEYLLIWTTFLDYLRRRIKWQSDHKEDLETFRLSVEKAIEQVDYYGTDGDPNGTLRQFWAQIEARHCNNLEKARELWSEIMTIGRANEAALWMEYYRFERINGDNKHCRRVLQRALNSVTDWPESIVDAYINFEREEGTLEQYDQAMTRCEAQMQRITERREKEAEKETAAQDIKKKGKADRKHQRRSEESAGEGIKTQHSRKQPNITQQQSHVPRAGNKRKLEESSKKTDGDFKVPAPVTQTKGGPPPGFRDQKSAPPPGFKGEKSGPPPGFKGEKSAPPPGFKGEKSALPHGFKGHLGSGDTVEGPDEPPVKKTREDDVAKFEHDSSADFRTAFISNLLFTVDETQIQNFFTKCGEIEEVRLVRTFKGQSKGFAYVQFKDELALANALTYDRTPIDGRPMFVSKCEDKRNRSKTDKFKFGTGLEKNKLFVKNLPFTCTEDALRTMFGQHGELRDVRLVTYRNGKSKGLAYVEYINEEMAQKALLKMDGILVGEHEISVAISNPPARKTPLTDREDTSFVPSLGGGKKETLTRGVARTQVMLMPRSVKQKPVQQGKGKPPSIPAPQTDSASTSLTQTTESDSGSKSEGMSNSDFRNMLLKK